MGATDTQYRLIRSNRRTLSLSLESDGTLVARAPMKATRAQIECFIAEKSEWIQKARARIAAHRRGLEMGALRDGGRLPYLGMELTVKSAGVPFGIDFHGRLLLPSGENMVQTAGEWRMWRAAEVLLGRVCHWATVTGFRPTKISFGQARGRWGSMNREGALRLNCALIHCSPTMIDYVIVHELCHRAEMNHSQAFHELVARWIPNEREIRAQMNQCEYYTDLLRPAKARGAKEAP